MKIALGTVQWGLNYGISNKNGIPSNDEIKSILTFAIESGIDLLDTASTYGNAENRIGNHSSKKFRIVTKLGSIITGSSIKEEVEKSLKNLKIKKIYGCLFHNANELLDNRSMWKDIQAQKKEGLIKKIGYSLYHPKELEKLLQLNYLPDLIQIPFNIIDRSFEPYFRQLKEMNIEIHARSIFLQGLLLNFQMMSQNKFSKWNPIWNFYQEWLKNNNLSPLEACIRHVLSYKEIKNFIIGVEQLSQLKQIIVASKKSAIKAPKKLISYDQKLINPLSWL